MQAAALSRGAGRLRRKATVLLAVPVVMYNAFAVGCIGGLSQQAGKSDIEIAMIGRQPPRNSARGARYAGPRDSRTGSSGNRGSRSSAFNGRPPLWTGR